MKNHLNQDKPNEKPTCVPVVQIIDSNDCKNQDIQMTPQLWIYPCCIKSWSSEARYYSSQQRRGTHHLALLCYLFAHTKIINKVGDCINFLQLFCTVEVFKQWPACRLALYSFLCLQLHRPVLIQIYAFYNS